MTQALVFSIRAAHRFLAGVVLRDDWSDTLEFGGVGEPIFTVRHADAAYVFRADNSLTEPTIIIRIEPGKLLSGFDDEASQLEALRRSVQAGILVLQSGGQLPDYWRPFSAGKYVTFQAQSLAKGDQRRIAIWRRLDGPDACAYVFDLTRSQKDYNSLNPDFDLLQTLLREKHEAFNRRPAGSTNLLLGPTTLDLGRLPEQVDTVVQGWKLTYLYKNRLTKHQREFVDAVLDGPIRLKGAAGTGKSLAMVAKLLREASAKKAGGQQFRFLFVTHNTSAAELAEEYALALDEADLVTAARDDEALIRIDTLLGLAIHDLPDDLGDLQPISNDAYDGKKLQLMILSDVIRKYVHGAWITHVKSASPGLRASLESSRIRRPMRSSVGTS